MGEAGQRDDGEAAGGITDDYLSHLQALCDAATPGEWRTLYGGMEGDNYAVIGSRSDVRPVCRIDPQDYRQGNVHAIVVAHNALPQLIAEVRRLRGEVGRVAIGVNDRHGKPIHVGDRMRFDPQEWGGECEFTIELDGGQIVHPGGTSDLSSWCEIISDEQTRMPPATLVNVVEKR